jgi:hypothetical protein
MWFDPATLLTDDLPPPANLANSANLSESTQPKTPLISKISKISKISNPVSVAEAISPDDKQKILSWLAHIGETDQEMIDDVLAQITNDAGAMAYFLKRAEEVKPVGTPIALIQCGNCQHFLSHHNHSKGSGFCNAGVQSPGLCWWSETPHPCDKYDNTS